MQGDQVNETIVIVSVAIVAVVLVLGLGFAVLRAFVLWYWRVNDVVDLLERIAAKLEKDGAKL